MWTPSAKDSVNTGNIYIKGGFSMRDIKSHMVLYVAGILVYGSLFMPAFISAQRNDIGYRKLMLGYARGQIQQIYNKEFRSDYKISDDGSTLVLTRVVVDKPVVLIALVFDHKNILYKINVKMRKDAVNPSPDEAMKVIVEKYGKPKKRTLTNTLDLMAYWHLDNNRYEIFFQNIASWDKFEVQYTDTAVQKQKEEYDKEMNKKPVNKELEF
jgi:hypothetical protein